MKLIPIREADKFSTLKVIEAVMNSSPQKALTPADMRARFKVMDKVEALQKDATELVLEDAEMKTLLEATTSFPWAVLDRDLLQVIEDMENAKAPPPAPLKSVDAA